MFRAQCSRGLGCEMFIPVYLCWFCFEEHDLRIDGGPRYISPPG